MKIRVNAKTFFLAVIFTIILTPLTVTIAKKPEGPINVLNTNAVLTITYIPLGNGNVKVIVEMEYDWECSTNPEFNGHAYQYAEGISRQKEGGLQFETLSGYGIFTSTGVEGTITYKIRNNYMLDWSRFWADRLTLWKGTGYFENIHGFGELDLSTFSFNLYIH